MAVALGLLGVDGAGAGAGLGRPRTNTSTGARLSGIFTLRQSGHYFPYKTQLAHNLLCFLLYMLKTFAFSLNSLHECHVVPLLIFFWWHLESDFKNIFRIISHSTHRGHIV